MAEQECITKQLKAENQIEWVRRMNNVKSRAEEMTWHELIYNWQQRRQEFPAAAFLCVFLQMGRQISSLSTYRPNINYLFLFIDRIESYIIAERELSNPLSAPLLDMIEGIFVGKSS